MRSDVSLINSIIEFCGDIEEMVDELDSDRDAFMNSRAHQQACSFCILQIGENAGCLSQELKGRYPEIEWNEIRGMRNLIAHGYHGIDLEAVWYAAIEDIQILKSTCERILNELERS